MKFFLRWLGISVVIAGIGVLIFLAFAPEGVEINQKEVGWKGTIPPVDPFPPLEYFDPFPMLDAKNFFAKVVTGKVVAATIGCETVAHRLFGMERVRETLEYVIISGRYSNPDPKHAYMITQEWSVSLSTIPAGMGTKEIAGFLELYGVHPSRDGSTLSRYWEMIVVPASVLGGYMVVRLWETRKRRKR